MKNPAKRLYDDACATAHALDLVGERWALLVIRELMLGPRRFSDLRAALPGISANVLTQRLEGLEADGLVVRRKLPPPATAQVYELTPWGYESEPIFQALGRWAARSPSHDPRRPLSAVSLFLSFRTMADPARLKGLTMRIGFRFGAETFLVRIAKGQLTVQRAPREELEDADAVFSGTPPAVAAAVYGGQSLDSLIAQKALHVTGDRAAAKAFTTLFTLPPKAAIPPGNEND